MKTSEQLNELATALAKAQGEMTHAEKTKVNPHFKNNYADIASIIEAIRIPFSKNGLSHVQLPIFLEGKSVLATRMMHSSGQWIESHTPILASKTDAQGFGSGLTYARRYALAAIAGIAQDDDDGNAAVQNKKQPDPRPTAPPVKTQPPMKTKNEAPVSQDQIKMLFAVANEKSFKHEEIKLIIQTFFKLESTKDLKRWQLDEVIAMVKTQSKDQLNMAIISKQQESQEQKGTEQ